MNEQIQAPTESVLPVNRKRGPIKPPGFIEDPVERRRLVAELAGSCPDMMTQEELEKRRWES